MLKSLPILILIAIISSSCCATPTPSQARLPLPEELTMPKHLAIEDPEWKCLGKENFWDCPAFKKLGQREKLYEKRIETLRNTIEKTH